MYELCVAVTNYILHLYHFCIHKLISTYIIIYYQHCHVVKDWIFSFTCTIFLSPTSVYLLSSLSFNHNQTRTQSEKKEDVGEGVFFFSFFSLSNLNKYEEYISSERCQQSEQTLILQFLDHMISCIQQGKQMSSRESCPTDKGFKLKSCMTCNSTL